MTKFNFKNKQWFIWLSIILVIVGVIFWLTSDQGGNKLPQSSYFKIIDDPKNVLYKQDVSELSVTPEAITAWEQKLKELEAAAPNIGDELERKRYYNDIGIYLGNLGRYQEAYGYYMKSLDISYIDRVTWLQLGDLLVKMKAYQSAEAAYLKGNEINPYEQLNYIKLADLYILMQKSESDIIDMYDQGIAKIDKPSLIFQAKAYYNEKNKNYAEALKTYEAWLEITDESNKATIQAAINSLKAKI